MNPVAVPGLLGRLRRCHARAKRSACEVSVDMPTQSGGYGTQNA